MNLQLKRLQKFYTVPSIAVGFIFPTPIQAGLAALEDC
jgi:hypothetical protein